MPPEAPAPITEPSKTPPASAPVGDPPPADRPADKPADGSAPPAKLERPEWLGKSFDAYWSNEKGIDATKFTTDVEAAFAAKAAADERAKQVPEKLEDYKVALPEGLKLPTGIKMEVLEKHPLLADARQFAKEEGLSQKAFQKLVALQAKGEITEYNNLKTRADEEKALLGENANARVQALTTKLTARIGAEHANQILPMMFTAKQVEALEKLVAEPAAARFNANGREPNQPAGITDAEYDAMSQTQRILRATKIQEEKRAKAS